MRLRRPSATLITLALLFVPLARSAAKPQAGADAPDDSKDRQIMERFKTVLEKTPRRGTALDRVYGYHVERGSLDALLKTYRDRVAKDKDDGAAWLLIGLFEAQRGRDAEAVPAFREAERARPTDALPSYYLGQALVLIGRPDDAADAFERGLSRKPVRADLLEIHQALGRVHQRAHRPEKALDVWTRLEKLFPDDLRVQEQIAAALAEEERPELALERYEKLSDRVTDGYRKIQLKLEAAAIKVRLGRGKEALADFEALLGRLDPDSWLARDVRRKVEEVFLRRDDLAGLAAYYDAWIKKTPDDIEAMTRLGRTLSQMGRTEDARKWLEKSAKLAPRRKDLRLALVDLLRKEGKFAAAAEQFEAMHKNDPGDPDVIRDWGRMLLADTTKTESERKKAAAEVWRRLVKEDAKDPVAAAQAAELFRQAGLEDDAIALFKKAIQLAPDASQYKEYLGEYYHALKRPADALAIWRATAEGPLRTAKNLGRLGEVLAGFGYRKEALEPLTEAVKLEPDDLDLRLKKADILLALDQPKEAETELDASETLAVDEEQVEAVLTRRIKAFQNSNTMGERIVALRRSLEAAPKADAKGWSRLARYLEADAKAAEAAQAAGKAVEADPKSIPAWTVLARLREQTGDLMGSAEASRTLAALDRRSRTDHLTNIAKLEARLGRREPALAAGRELLAAAPGNPEHEQFFADLCFALGESEEGLQALRRSVRANPSDPKAMSVLAENLAKLFRAEESIELYWRAFEKTTDLEGKIGVVAKMTEQYLQRNQFDRLLARIERELREQDQQRERSLCLAAAHSAAGDYVSARQELEKLLGVYPKDLVLLRQLSGLSENSGDFAGAAGYQLRINEIAPSEEGDARLATLYLRTGDLDAAVSLWTKIGDGDADSARLFTSIDSLMASGRREVAAQVIQSRLRRDPKNWELLYRLGVSLVEQGKPAEAGAVFDEILAFPIDPDTPTASAAKAKAGRGGPGGPRLGAAVENFPPILYRTNAAYYARQLAAYRPPTNAQVTGMNPLQGWTPTDFGQVRVLAMTWKALREDTGPPEARYAARVKRASDEAPDDARKAWDLYYLGAIQQEPATSMKAAERLAKLLPDDPTAQYIYLSTRETRAPNVNAAYRAYYGNNVASTAASNVPTSSEQLDRMLRAAKVVLGSGRNWNTSNLFNGLSHELKQAKREEEAKQLTRGQIAGASNYQSFQMLSTLLAQQSDVEGLKLLEQRYQAVRATMQQATNNAYYPIESMATGRLIGVLGEKHDADGVLKTLDAFRAARRTTRSEDVRKAAMLGPRSNLARINNQIVVYSGTQGARSVVLDVLTGVESLGVADLQVLRGAFEAAKDDGWIDRLVGYLSSGEGKSKEARHDDLVAASLVQWWNTEREEAVETLRRAAALQPDDVQVALGLADMLGRRGDLVAALETVDKVEATDQTVTQKRETAALRYAVRIGDSVRARKAAERLFGLRLDAQTQIELANQMSLLGMYDMADAVLNRAQRDAGNRGTALVSLMYQFQNQGKTEEAVEVAYQVLRQSPAPASANAINPQTAMAINQGMMISGAMNAPGADQSLNNRRQALAALSRAGRLRDLIAKAEAMRASSPGNVPLIRTLIEYYNSDNRPDQARKLEDELAKLQPDNGRARLAVAAGLVDQGKLDEARTMAKDAFQADPNLLLNQANPYLLALRKKAKEEDMESIYESIDLTRLQQSWPVYQAAVGMIGKPKAKRRGIALLGKILKSFPNERYQYVYQTINANYASDVPDLYEAARDIPLSNMTSLQSQPWAWTEAQLASAASGGNKSFGSILIGLAERMGKLDDLEATYGRTLEQYPRWLGGRAILAVIGLRKGRTQEAEKTFREMLSDKRVPIPPITREWIVAELRLNGLASLAEEIDGKGLAEALASLESGEYEVPAVLQVASRLNAANRKAEAIDLLTRLGATKPVDLNNPGQTMSMYFQYVTLQVGRQLQNMGANREAMEFYERSRRFVRDARITEEYEAQRTNFLSQIRDLMEGLLRSAKPEDRESFLGTILLGDESAKLDLGLAFVAEPVDQAVVTSRSLQWLAGMAKDEAAKKSFQDLLRKGQTQRPDDMNILVMLIASEEKSPETPADVAKLRVWAEKHPLPSGPPPRTAKERAPYGAQIGLWLAARVGLKNPASRADAEFLAERALDAARRMPNAGWSQAILREWGDLAATLGDKAQAERLWTRLLETIVEPAKPKPSPKAATFRPNARPNVRLTQFSKSAGPLTPPPAAPELVPPRPRTTRARFDQSLAVARLAASKGMTELSMKAAREAFAAGPPMDVAEAGTEESVSMSGTRFFPTRQPFGLTSMTEMPEQSPGGGGVSDRMRQLEAAWAESGVPVVKIYEVFRDAVVPPNRPNEVALFGEAGVQRAMGMNGTPSQLPTVKRDGLSSQLVDLAVRAKAVDDLGARLRRRASIPACELNALVVLAEIARATDDPKATNDLLRRFDDRLKVNSLQNTIELAIQVAGPAIEVDATAEAAAAVLDRALKLIQKAPAGSPLNSVGLQLARYEYRRKNPDAARARLETYLDAQDRIQRRSGLASQTRARRSLIDTVVMEVLKIDRPLDALELLGRSADLPFAGDATTQSNLMPILARRLATLPTKERYERLRTWTLPTKDRRSIRLIGSKGGEWSVPAEFSALAAANGLSPKPPEGIVPGILTTQALLVEAAKAEDRLDALAEEVAKLADDGVENAEALRLLLDGVRGRFDAAAPRFAKLMDDRDAPPANRYDMYGNVEGQQNWTGLVDLETAVLFLDHPPSRERAVRFLQKWSTGTEQGAVALANHLKRKEAERLAPDLKWSALGVPQGWRSNAGVEGSVWLHHEGVTRRYAGAVFDNLTFGTPLRGTFAIEGEYRPGNADNVNFGFMGRPLTNPRPNRPQTSTPPLSQIAGTGEFNRFRIEVGSNVVRNYVNGQLVAEFDAASPWLDVFVSASSGLDFRHVRIVGTPEVPRTLDLLADGDFGWSASVGRIVVPTSAAARPPASSATAVVGGLVPPAPVVPTPAVAALAPQPPVVVRPQAGPTRTASEPPSWSIDKGTLTGRRATSGATVAASSIRRTVDGGPDGVYSYEYFYEPGVADVRPTLGSTLFEWDADGVSIRPLQTQRFAVAGLPTDATVRLADAKPPVLKPKDWNKVEIAKRAGVVRLSINGQEVFNRRIDLGEPQTLGFRHDRTKTEARIRNLSLVGDWPSSVPASLFPGAPSTDGPKPASLDKLVDERIRADDGAFVVATAKAAKPVERYETLARFVLPNEDHAALRVQGRFNADGGLVSPSVELIEAASAADRLDDLARRLDEVKTDDRARKAFATMLAVARKRDDEAKGLLDALRGGWATVKTEDLDLEPWPEFLAARSGLGRAETRTAATALLDKTLEPFGRAGYGQTPLVAALARLKSPEGGPVPRWFTTIDRSTARGRASGVPAASWTVKDGVFRHVPGNDRDALAFRIPIAGDFEATAELSTGSRLEETRMSFGDIWIGPSPDRSEIVKYLPGRTLAESSSSALPKDLGETYRYKLTLRGNRLSAFVDDKPIGEHVFDDVSPRWLTLDAPWISIGTVKNLNIALKGKAPKSVDLSKSLAGWTPDLVRQQTGGVMPQWNEGGGEFLGSLAVLVNRGGNEEETFLSYRTSMSVRLGRAVPMTRAYAAGFEEMETGQNPIPMEGVSPVPVDNLLNLNRSLGDGETIEYETFHAKEGAIAAPTIGRTALLVADDGLALRTIGDVPYDRTIAMRPDATKLDKPAPKLAPDSWVKVSVGLKDGKVATRINGELLEERPAPPGTAASFGLLHRLEFGNARVKNVRLVAEWPDAAPPADKLVEAAR